MLLDLKGQKQIKFTKLQLGVNTNKYIKPLKKLSSQVPNNDYLIFKEHEQALNLQTYRTRSRVFSLDQVFLENKGTQVIIISLELSYCRIISWNWRYFHRILRLS